MTNSGGGNSATIFVEATLDDTLRDVRKQLLEKDSYDHVYVLIRMEPDQFAVISAFGLSKLVNTMELKSELGRNLLDVTLGQLRDHFLEARFSQDVLPPQSGVERSTLEDWQKQEEAKKYRNYLLLLQGGQPVDVFDKAIPSIIASGYDLLDEPIAIQALNPLRAIEAKVNHTVRYVLNELRKIPDRDEWDQAVVLLKTGREQFKVIKVEQLRQAVEADPVGALDKPLVAYPDLQKPADVLDHDYDSQLSVENAIIRAYYVVIVRSGKPPAVIPGNKLLRRGLYGQELELATPSSPQADVEPTGDWGQPKAAISEGPTEVNLEQPREVLPRFEHDGRPYPKERALVYGQRYEFKLSIDVYDAVKSELPEKAREKVPVFPPAEEGGHRLYVSLFSEDFALEQHTQPLWLPNWGSSEDAIFQVTPIRRTVGPHDRAVLTVCVYYRCNVVQVLEMSTPVVTAVEEAEAVGREWALKAARTKDFVTIETLRAKKLGLVISREREGRYLFTFSVDPEEAKATKWDRIRLGCRIEMTRDDLTHLVTKARRQMYHAVQAYNLLRDSKTGTYDRAMRALAQVGRQLYRRLFGSGDGEVLAEWMEDNLTEGSTIQILNRAGDFVFPWSLIYEGSPWDEEVEIDPKQFWGWRYKLAMTTDALVDTTGEAGDEIETPQGLDVMVGLYARLKGARDQYSYFTGLQNAPEARVRSKIVENRADAVDALKTADPHLVYFFCHGYTEKMVTDIQLDDDLVREFAAREADKIEQKDEAILEHLDDMFNVSDSWMRLTRGRILLTMLQEQMDEYSLTRHPLVFLNMCQSAQVLPSLSGGLVPFFIDKGARAVIATECSMNMTFGDQFSRDFLDRFLEAHPAAEVLWRLRQEYLDKRDPLALAYTLFGDADVRLQEPVVSALAESS